MTKWIVKTPGYFDRWWADRIAVAAEFLRDAQNRWLVVDDPFPTDFVARVVFRIFAENGLHRQTYDVWQDTVDAPFDEYRQLLPPRTKVDCEQAVSAMMFVLDNAVESWTQDAGSLPSDQLALQCAEELASRRFIQLYGS